MRFLCGLALGVVIGMFMAAAFTVAGQYDDVEDWFFKK